MEISRRRQLDGTLSCRIKIVSGRSAPSYSQNPPLQSQIVPTNFPTSNSQQPQTMPIADTLNSLGSPGSRRKDKIHEAIQSMANLNSNMEALELPSDPDAQATVTDFLDFTEYLPSDMMRSLTLIGNLDETYLKSYNGVDGLTKTYGKLPQLPSDGKPDPVKLRTDISQNLSEATRARTLSSTEAYRMSNNVDRHYNRAKNILAKLQAMAEAYPPSRESSPVPQQKADSPVVSRPPRITLRVDGARSGGEVSAPRVRKHRAPRITVPGEVLAPYELDYESYDSQSDTAESDEDDPLTPRQTPARTTGTSNGTRIKLKVPKQPKSRATPKPMSQPRTPGMGTNVHSSVAGISTSNALAKLKPPPSDAEKGSEDAPWLQLTDWELGMLRKRMKKNAVWSPSDTMIARELKNQGRGIEAYRAAKKLADESGEHMPYGVPPQLLGQSVNAEGAISVDAVRGDQDLNYINRGMKLNEAKKLKKEVQAKEQATAAEQAKESVRKISEAAQAMKDLFAPSEAKKVEKNTPAKPLSKTPARKRKRPQGNIDSDVIEQAVEPAANSDQPDRPQIKRNKTETPVPTPQPLSTRATKQATPASFVETSSVATSIASETPMLPVETIVGKAPVPNSAVSRKKETVPVLPPVQPKQTRAEVKKENEKAAEKPSSTRVSRSSTVIKTPTPGPEPLPSTAKRPTSSRGKAPSQEPNFQTGSATIDRPRRTSTARNTPAPLPPAPVQKPNTRTKRPAPGVITAASEDSSAVSVGKRTGATRRKASSAKKEKKDGREGSAVQETFEEYDDQGNLIPPDEPRYCICNRVSFGTMIACENEQCEKEWFHLECVGLTETPRRTKKWYCPDCGENNKKTEGIIKARKR